MRCITAISARPVDTPAPARCRSSVQPLGRAASGVVIERGDYITLTTVGDRVPGHIYCNGLIASYGGLEPDGRRP